MFYKKSKLIVDHAHPIIIEVSIISIKVLLVFLNLYLDAKNSLFHQFLLDIHPVSESCNHSD